MKRLVITLPVLAVLGMIASSLPTLAQPTQVPHENPLTATGPLDKPALLLSYSQIFNLATSRQYQGAQDSLKEIKTTDFPGELRYIMDRYSYLCQQLFTNLDNLERLLEEMSNLLARNQIHEVQKRLGDAEGDIENARAQREDIVAATDSLVNLLGVFASPMTSQLRQAYTRLEASLESLGQLIDELNRLWRKLNERYTQVAELMPTELSLSINPASVFIGDSITASGTLSSAGQPLAGRNLLLHLDNKPIAVTTASDGSYASNINIPCKYVTAMTLTAVYEPTGDDTDIYLASQSPPLTINTRFHHTRLEVSAPEAAYPGLPFAISGRVSSGDDNIGRRVEIFIDKNHLAEEEVAGPFRLEVTPPPQLSTGKHKLTVNVVSRGRYSGATETRGLNISQQPIYLETQAPKIIILPKATQISGQVYHELGPLPGARVSLSSRNTSSWVTTPADGSFTIPLRTLLDLSPASLQESTMTVTPVEPWYTTLKVKRQLFIINPLSVELIIIALLAMWIIVDMGSLVRRREEAGVTRVELIEPPPTTPAPEPKPGLTGIKGRILAAYRGGLEIVEKSTGVVMAPNITLREFLKMARLLLPLAIRHFAELTGIAEIALYSARSLREDSAKRAEKLAANIKEELRHGTS